MKDESDTRQGSDAEHAFRAEVRQFLDAALTEELRAAGRATVGTHSEIGASRRWHQRLHERGWITPAWPVEHGGTGWTARQRLIFDRECAAHDAPVLFAGGIRNVGPLLIALGSAAQQAFYLPRIRSGADLWCQGYSEVVAGSDLANLRTSARRVGDHYVINGRKIWTTGADLADRMFALVRTRAAGKPQQGITFLLVDMRTPGIRVRPVQTISGEAEFNEVTFEDVQVPVEDRVGAEDDGWTVAKQLMYYARASNTTCGLLRRALRRTTELQARCGTTEPGARRRLDEAELRLAALERIEYAAAGSDRTAAREFHASTMKLLATELHQRITEVALELAGPLALEQRDAMQSLAATPFAHAASKYFATRAATIYSGTSEVHRNILGRQLVG
ncbi:MAG: acyl-CoA dehydrogenase family protein [Pseudomonadales bacterium]|nr:acyl-CoA dehydrogenase family protein [Pseudomonadales bacterium]